MKESNTQKTPLTIKKKREPTKKQEKNKRNTLTSSQNTQNTLKLHAGDVKAFKVTQYSKKEKEAPHTNILKKTTPKKRTKNTKEQKEFSERAEETSENSTQKKKVGRPEVMTQEVIEKILEAFKKGLTIRHACIHAGIAVSTYYKYKEENIEFSERAEEASENCQKIAQEGLYELLKCKDPATIRWYLQKTDPRYKDFIFVENTKNMKPLNPEEEKNILSLISQ